MQLTAGYLRRIFPLFLVLFAALERKVLSYVLVIAKLVGSLSALLASCMGPKVTGLSRMM